MLILDFDNSFQIEFVQFIIVKDNRVPKKGQYLFITGEKIWAGPVPGEQGKNLYHYSTTNHIKPQF